MSASRFTKVRVLVVEDQAFVRQIVKGIVRSLGFDEIQEAADGTAALEKVRSSPPHLIVCDIQMQPMGGLEFLKILRASPVASHRRIPFIFLTSLADEATVKTAIDDGVDAYLLKPVSHTALEARIRHVLGATVS